MSIPVIFTRDTGVRVIVNWDSVAFISPEGEDETRGSIVHFNAPQDGESNFLEIREGLGAIERLLQSATRA
jgi:hypothetical protein